MRHLLIFCALALVCAVPALGAELEVPGLDQVWEEAEGYGVAREGSLDAGLELVTHPLSLHTHLGEMPWRELCQKAVSLGYGRLLCGECA